MPQFSNINKAQIEQAQSQKEVTANDAIEALAKTQGVLSKSVAAGGTIDLTEAEAMNGLILLTGAPSSAVTVRVPVALNKMTMFRNDVTSASTIAIKVQVVGVGTAQRVPHGGGRVLLWNGAFHVLPRIAAAVQATQGSRDGADFGGKHADDPRYFVTGLYLPRKEDLDGGIIYDFQDDAAYLDKRSGTTITVTPNVAASSGANSDLFRDDTASLTWNSATSPYPITIELDMNSNPLPNLGAEQWSVGITFRSSSGGDNPTNIKIEQWNSGSSAYVTVFDAAPEPIQGTTNVFLSPRFTSPQLTLNKVRITLSGTNPIAGAGFRIQRVILYHQTGVFDPWHLHVKGGRVFGDVTLDAALSVGGIIGGSASPITLRRRTQAMADANQTPTSSVYDGHVIECTGALTAQRDLILPTVDGGTWVIDNKTTGGFGIQAKTSAGTGVVIAAARAATVRCDGTNIRRVTADIDPTT